MDANRAFIDTNIFIYYQRSDDNIKQKISESAINFFDCVVSTQVLNEICNLLTRKYPTSIFDIKKFILDIKNSSELVLITEPTIAKALDIYMELKLSFFDALIVSAALEANCNYLISEDMHDGLIIENKLQIVNIYKHTDLLNR